MEVQVDVSAVVAVTVTMGPIKKTALAIAGPHDLTSFCIFIACENIEYYSI